MSKKPKKDCTPSRYLVTITPEDNNIDKHYLVYFDNVVVGDMRKIRCDSYPHDVYDFVCRCFVTNEYTSTEIGDSTNVNLWIRWAMTWLVRRLVENGETRKINDYSAYIHITPHIKRTHMPPPYRK